MQQSLEELIHFCLEQSAKVREADFDLAPEVVAAAALEAQLLLADILAEAEMRAKQSEDGLELVEAEATVDIRSSDDPAIKKLSGEKKLTEGLITALVNKSEKVKEAKVDRAIAVKEFKKWKYVNDTLLNVHIFFRGLAKKE